MCSITNLSYNHGTSVTCAICKNEHWIAICLKCAGKFPLSVPWKTSFISLPPDWLQMLKLFWSSQPSVSSIQLSLVLFNKSEPRFCFTWLDSVNLINNISRWCINTHSTIMVINCFMNIKQRTGRGKTNCTTGLKISVSHQTVIWRPHEWHLNGSIDRKWNGEKN